jgi:hypothetical protein
VQRKLNFLFAAAFICLLVAGRASQCLVAPACAADESVRAGADFLNPKNLAGTIYDSDSKKVLFTFRRTAVESNSTIHVLREYTLPNGSLAARERVVYVAGKLASFQLEELQSHAQASVTIQPESKSSAEQRIVFNYTRGSTKKTGSEKLQPDVVINDMVAPFILAHWDQLMSGATVKLRMVAPSRAETVGFKLVKESETTQDGKPVVIIRMEPGSVIIAQFINPLHFTIERDGSHHILRYSGRTTPSIQRNGKWEYLDALTVFDWK